MHRRENGFRDTWHQYAVSELPIRRDKKIKGKEEKRGNINVEDPICSIWTQESASKHP